MSARNEDGESEKTRDEAAATSSPSARRPKNTGEKRERILKAAIHVFARKGFYATRVSEIAEAAGVADGTIYLYFKNKDDVLISLFDERITRLTQVLREVANEPTSATARLQKIIALQLGQMEGRRDLAEVVTVNLRQSTRLLKQFAAPLFAQYIEVLAGVVEDGQRHGEFRKDVSATTAARALWGAIDGVLLTWALTSDGEDSTLRAAALELAYLYVDGLRLR